MQRAAIQRVVGILLALFSLTMLPPVAVAIIYNETTFSGFSTAFALTLITGLALWLPVAKVKQELRLRDGFLIVALFWLVLGSFGSLPFLFDPGLRVVDAVFESMSGLTTTGATVITNLNDLSHSILFYRQMLQWLGGMGIIVLAVAILPMLGIGGMQLYRAETPGPLKDSKLTPRITETAKALWYLYLGLTLACAGSYWLAGMGAFDAITHSFSTVAIGGFSTHDESFGFFDSRLIEFVAIIFMVISGINFSIHFIAWRTVSLRPYKLDPEFKAYAIILLLFSLLSCTYLIYNNIYEDLLDSIVLGIFQTVSIATTAGFTTGDYVSWPIFIPIMLLLVSFIGGCAGSTGGGMKVIRILLLIKQGQREIRRLIHPNAVFHIKIGNKPLSNPVINAVWGFFSLYVMSFCIMSLMLTATGLDLVTSFSAVAACMNNLGPGLGQVSANYASINDTAKWILCFAMLVGRLEVFTILVIITPEFWRK